MPGRVIGTSLNIGYPGTPSRSADSIIQNRIADAVIAFGQAVILKNTNRWDTVTDTTVAADIAGIAVREVVQANTFDPQSNPDYVANAPCDVMVRGNCTVKCQRGTPAAGTAVYVRIKANSTYPNAVVGGFEASADSTNTIQVPNIEWTTGSVDANGVAEVTIKTRAKG